MNPIDVTVDVEIGGEKRKLYFNLNAFSKFEEASSLQADGKRLKFPRFFFGLLDAWTKMEQRNAVAFAAVRGNSRDRDKLTAEQQKEVERIVQSAAFEALGEIGASDVLALIYAGCHVYDARDNPSWPLSPGQLGKLVSVMEMVAILPKIMEAMKRNVPQKSDAPEAKGGEEPKRPTTPPPLTVIDGGSPSGELDESPLDFLTVKSGA